MAMNQAEDLADQVLRVTKSYLKPVARVCLLSTFAEDGIRMFYQWDDQIRFVERTWHSPWFIAMIFVLLNLSLQIIPVVMILIQKKVEVAVGCLFGVVILQTLAYSVLWDLRFFLRNLAVCGGLLLVLAEGASTTSRPMFAGLPSLEQNNKGNYLQFAGRILIVLMFLTTSHFDSVFRIIFVVLGFALVVLVAVGYKTKLSAFALVILLTLENVTLNAWWSISVYSSMRDFVKYDFFQTMSVIGGLLLVVALGPGGVSMDERKKEY